MTERYQGKRKRVIAGIGLAVSAVLLASSVPVFASMSSNAANAAEENTDILLYDMDLAFDSSLGEDLLQGVLSPTVTDNRIALMEQRNQPGEELLLNAPLEVVQPQVYLSENDDLFSDYSLSTKTPTLQEGRFPAYIQRVNYTNAEYATTFYKNLVKAHNASTTSVIVKDSSFSPDGKKVLSSADGIGKVRKTSSKPPEVEYIYSEENPEEIVDVKYIYDYDSVGWVIGKIKTANGRSIAKYQDAILQNYYSAWNAFTHDHPEAFFASRYVPAIYLLPEEGQKDRYTVACLLYQRDALGTSDWVWRAYDWDQASIENTNNQMEDTITSIIANAGTSSYDKVRYFNKWLCDNNEYNNSPSPITPDASGRTPSYKPYVSVSALIDTGENPVCEGYARAMQLLCNKAGIGCTIATGTGGNVAHMWNQIEIEGKWYNSDTTWNDTGTVGADNDEYLLVGSAAIAGSHKLTNNYYPSPVDNENVNKVLHELMLTNHPLIEDTDCKEPTDHRMPPVCNVPPDPIVLVYGTPLNTLDLSDYFMQVEGNTAGYYEPTYQGQEVDKVGPYTLSVTAWPTDDETYVTSYEFNIVVNVVPQPISATIELPDGDRYKTTGSPITPNIVVRDESGEVIPPSNYTVEYENNLNAGTAVAYIDSNDGYEYSFSLARSFTIYTDEPVQPEIKDQPAFNLPAIKGAVYGGSVTLTTTGGAQGTSIAYEVVSGPAVVSGDTISFVGTGACEIRATSIADGYNPAYATTKFEIAKRQVSANILVSGKLFDGTPDISVTVVSVNGRANGDTESDVNILASGKMTDAAVGTDKPVTVRFELAGSKKDMYVLNAVSKETTVTVSPTAIPSDVAISFPTDVQVDTGVPASSVLRKTASFGEVSGNVAWFIDAERTKAVPDDYTFQEGSTTLYWSFVATGNYKGTVNGSSVYVVDKKQPPIPTPETTFQVVGNAGIAADAKLDVTGEIVLHANKTSKISDDLAAKLTDTTVCATTSPAESYEVKLMVNGSEMHTGFGSITLHFPVMTKIGSTAVTDVVVWHKHQDGSITSSARKVVSGKVDVAVTDLSEFLVTTTVTKVPSGDGDDGTSNGNTNNNTNSNANSSANSNANDNTSPGGNSNNNSNANNNTDNSNANSGNSNSNINEENKNSSSSNSNTAVNGVENGNEGGSAAGNDNLAAGTGNTSGAGDGGNSTSDSKIGDVQDQLSDSGSYTGKMSQTGDTIVVIIALIASSVAVLAVCMFLSRRRR